jgi:hypothetical protein
VAWVLFGVLDPMLLGLQHYSFQEQHLDGGSVCPYGQQLLDAAAAQQSGVGYNISSSLAPPTAFPSACTQTVSTMWATVFWILTAATGIMAVSASWLPKVHTAAIVQRKLHASSDRFPGVQLLRARKIAPLPPSPPPPLSPSRPASPPGLLAKLHRRNGDEPKDLLPFPVIAYRALSRYTTSTSRE